MNPAATTFGLELHTVVRSASHRADLCAAVQEIYLRLQTEIDQRKPLCVASGKCCHFDAYGHRLYVTTLELAAFLADIRALAPSLNTPVEGRGEGDFESPKSADTPNHPLPIFREIEPEKEVGSCPLQIGMLCGVHAIRPFGCRIFFCDASATEWQQQQYERFHAEIKQLHERFNVQYFYLEWRQALAALGI